MGYYRGDYYRGDPGLLSFLGKGIKFAAGLLGGTLGSGKSGVTIASKAVAALPGAGAIIPAAKATIAKTGAFLAKHPTATAAAAAGTLGAVGAGAGMLMGAPASTAMPVGMMPGGGMGAMRGFHISKHTGQMVRNRRMRVTNPRALRRAIRRANGFARLAKRVLHFTSPRAPRGRAVFKKRARKRT